MMPTVTTNFLPTLVFSSMTFYRVSMELHLSSQVLAVL
jgi:hypothetical protein